MSLQTSRICCLFTLGTALASLAACSHQPVHTDYATFVREPRVTTPGVDYRLGVPDQLVVTVSQPPFQQEHRLTLAHPGDAYVPGYVAVPAVGRTPAELAAALQAQSPDADIAVRVEAFASQKVFVFGQVHHTGGQPYNGANTVLQVLAEAQPNVRADIRHVQVLRPSPDGQFRRRMTVDVDAMVRMGDTTLDVVLDEGDVVFVPPTTLGSLGLAWAQLFSTGSNHAPNKPDRSASTPPPHHEPQAESDPRVAEATEAQARALVQLQQAIHDLNREVQAMRKDAAAAAARQQRTVAADPVQFQPTTTGRTAVYATDHPTRGGAGERPEPTEGVRFWGP